MRLIPLLAALLLAPAAAGANEAAGFDTFLAGVRQDAVARGIRPATVDAALSGLSPLPRVLELDRRQPEFTLSFDEYLRKVVNDARVERGRQLLREHRATLDAVAERFGVQPRFVVALWGIETDYGRLTGGFQVVPALATLAHDGRRSAFFRGELLNALEILDRENMRPESLRGSWAGAMGQSQFMPSSYLRFAVDFDGDGRRDIWNSRADVFASAANYLSRSGWKKDETWGRAVRLPADFDAALAGGQVEKSLAEWQALGVRKIDGSDLPARPLSAGLILPAGGEGPAYLVYSNYRTILRWNRSASFAIAVGTLADRLADG